MFVADLPYTPPSDTPIVLAETSVTAPTAIDYILNGCQETQSTGNPRSAVRAVDPAALLMMYLGNTQNKVIKNIADIKLTLLQPTTVGTLVGGLTNYGRVVYRYDAPEGYVGNDRAVFLAEFEGKRYKIVLDLRVFEYFDENTPTVCPEPTLIEIKKPLANFAPTPFGISLSTALVEFNFTSSATSLGKVRFA